MRTWRQQRNMLATLFLSHGTPMLLAGDEFGRAQQANNNAYCQDTGDSCVDWTLANDERGRELIDFVRRLMTIRRDFPVLRRNRFLTGETFESLGGIKDAVWLTATAEEMPAAHWQALTRVHSHFW